MQRSLRASVAAKKRKPIGWEKTSVVTPANGGGRDGNLKDAAEVAEFVFIVLPFQKTEEIRTSIATWVSMQLSVTDI